MIGCVLGPTGSGKSSFAIKAAKAVGGAIISCDSVQVYRGFNIGSGKVCEKEMDGIPHYLLDITTAEINFTVADYVKKLHETIAQVEASGLFPILVGGTGLYYRAFAYQYAFKDKKEDVAYRGTLYQMAEDKGSGYLHTMLKAVDPISAEKIHPNHITRIVRALEAYHLTGKPIWEQEEESLGLRDDLFSVVLDVKRNVLYEGIEKRVDEMIEDGLLEEVKSLLDAGISKAAAPMTTIGYKEMVAFLEGDMTFEESIARMKQSTRQYAKRQLTWFRKHEEVTWLAYTTAEEKEKSLNWFIEAIQNIQRDNNRKR